jgi:hypothetical protein
LYNPTGTFDNDQYLLEIVVPQGDPGGVFTTLETWLTACESDCLIEELDPAAACGVSSPAIPLPDLSNGLPLV